MIYFKIIGKDFLRNENQFEFEEDKQKLIKEVKEEYLGKGKSRC